MIRVSERACTLESALAKTIAMFMRHSGLQRARGRVAGSNTAFIDFCKNSDWLGMESSRRRKSVHLDAGSEKPQAASATLLWNTRAQSQPHRRRQAVKSVNYHFNPQYEHRIIASNCSTRLQNTSQQTRRYIRHHEARQVRYLPPIACAQVTC